MHVPEHRHARVCYADCNMKVKKKPAFITCTQSPKVIPKRHTSTSKYCVQLQTHLYLIWIQKLERCFFVAELKCIQ